MPGLGESVRLIRGARIVGGDGLPLDVRIAHGVIAQMAPAGTLGGVADVAADGMWLAPGLWDHHVHTGVAALTADRVALAEATSWADAATRVAAAPIDADGRRIGAGYRVATWPDEPSLEVLDAITGATPTYLVNADLHSVWLNTAAIQREAPSEHVPPTGVVTEHLAFDLSARLAQASDEATYAAVSRLLRTAATRGVVGIVDFDFDATPEAWRRRVGRTGLPVRVQCGVYPNRFDEWVRAGLRTGDPITADGGVRAGSLKIITDGSLGTRTAACTCAYDDDPDNFGELSVHETELQDLMRRAHGAGVTVAAHAIGDVSNRLVIDAFEATSARGTIEHAQLVASDDIARLAQLPVAASVQPEHTLDDLELLARYWQQQKSVTYPLASLVRSGVPVLLGSDAPVAPLDPWVAMAAAVFRRRGSEPAYCPEEALTFTEALSASTHGPIAVGSPADLVLLGHDPAQSDAAALRTTPVALTLLGGQATHVA